MGKDGEICGVPACDKPAKSRGLCDNHYYHFRHPGSRDHAAAKAAALPAMSKADAGRMRARARYDKPGTAAARKRAAAARGDADPAVNAIVDARIETATTMAAALKLTRVHRADGIEFIDPRTGTTLFQMRDGSLHAAEFTVGHTIQPNPEAM